MLNTFGLYISAKPCDSSSAITTGFLQTKGFSSVPYTAEITAEILWRYLSGDVNFMESHTGLEDVQIETKILVHCLKTHKKIRKALFQKSA